MNVFIFEGPQLSGSVLKGWRHYQIRLASGSVRNFIAQPERAKGIVYALKAELFPAGTWEAAGEVASGLFPLPRPEILEMLCGGTATRNLAGQVQA